MFLKVRRKRGKAGEEVLCASVAEDRRQGKQVVQRTVVSIGRVTEEQVPYPRAARS